MKKGDWHTLSAFEIMSYYNTDIQNGLSSVEADQRLQRCGTNELLQEKSEPWWALLLRQFQDFMVLVLFAAILISAFLGEYIDAITILTIVIINAVLGFIQEYRAEKSLRALQQLAAPTAHVIRNGQSQHIPASKLVPGDVLLVDSGDRIAADARLVDSVNLALEEAALTGESIPVNKDETSVCQQDCSLGDYRNMVFAGTSVVRGRGTAIVVETGMNTQVGHIAGMIANVQQEETPLQRRLQSMGKWLVFGCVIVCSAVVVTGWLKGETLFFMCMSGISLAVAAIPEGLPAIVTVCLALGVQRMIRRNAIIRKLPAVETLGCTTVICTDKTGTLTQNKMTVRKIFVNGRMIDVTGNGYEPKGSFFDSKQEIAVTNNKSLLRLLTAACLCNNAQLKKNHSISINGLWRTGSDNDCTWNIDGDPTEGSLVVAAAKAGLWSNDLQYQRVNEIPFESERRRMAVVCRDRVHKDYVFVKGAPDVLFDLCTSVEREGIEFPFTAEWKQIMIAANDEMAAEALRVIAVAYRKLPDNWEIDQFEQQLTLVGLVGMIDPPREEVYRAIGVCKQAGIKTVMITGDHPSTAVAIARELGMLTGNATSALTGIQLDQISDPDLLQQIDTISVYARVSPNHKLRIVQALKKRGHIVAMTGDGVNDAPAIKEADIGIAMGSTGTDVAKEASAMILTDDNFATIVAAVEEGRGIYDNIRKFIRYLLASNTGEVLTMFLATLIGFPLPILPVQILFINLVTDGLPAMALSMEPVDRDVMQRTPRRSDEGIFSQGLSRRILLRGLQIGVSVVAVFSVGFFVFHDLVLARTMAFTTLVLSQLCYVFDCKHERSTGKLHDLFSNIFLIAAVACSVTMQMCAIYLPWGHNILGTCSLTAPQLGIVVLVSAWTLLKQYVSRLFLFPFHRKDSYIKL